MRLRIASLAVLLAIFAPAVAGAGHHSWDITELYSNSSGSVQYVELFCPVNGEAGLGPFTLTSTTNTLNFVTNLSSSTTANTWVLCATSNFSSLAGGIPPDYVIPANFFPILSEDDLVAKIVKLQDLGRQGHGPARHPKPQNENPPQISALDDQLTRRQQHGGKRK